MRKPYPLFHDGLILYTYLHLAADKEQMDALLNGKVKAVAYETIQETDGSLPCLAPMSQIAGRLSIQEAAKKSKVIASGVNCYLGKLTNENVAKAHGYEYANLNELI